MTARARAEAKGPVERLHERIVAGDRGWFFARIADRVAERRGAMGLSQRSIWRYLAAMQAAGIDFEQEARWPAPAWRLDRRAWLGLLDLPTRRSA